MVPGAGVEPARCYHRGIFLPAMAFATDPLGIVWGLDYTFTFYHFQKTAVRREPSSLYTSPEFIT
jgi:hypothetical protein